ncbi:SigE family RNA polymerase sigma factor [Catellatospora vulcania]|uniref:SigE family RNA polymerase sigma factor n=1 Tax=Catellatospora vulcania TaxID=1460450 RepID=UPI001E35BABC|nr:SigE family RNA polymerase sigma factor [Catellatospora vulcania]
MAETAEFDEFVATRSRHLLRVAYLLTGDHGLAEDLLQTALARSWSAWRRLDGNPEPYVRQVLLNTYNSWWRRRWNGERPTEMLPERARPAPQSSVDERDEVWRALSRLSRQQRTVLVLRYFEDLSEAEIAQTLHISPGAVKSHASKGLARLRLDPSLRDLPVGEDAPVGNERLAAVHERIAQRRRNRIAAVAAVCVVVLAAITGYAVAPYLRSHSLPEPATSELPGPRFLDGRRVLASTTGELTRAQGVTLTWTPEPGQDLDIFVECFHDLPGSSVGVSVFVNGAHYRSASCNDVRRVDLRVEWFDLLTEAGRPAVVSTQVSGVCRNRQIRRGEMFQQDCAPAPMPEGGTLVLGVGEPVPFAGYPLPAAPKQLLPLEPLYEPLRDAVLLKPGTQSTTLAWLGSLSVQARAQTPGRLHILVDGKRVQTLDFWDYEQDDASANQPASAFPRGTMVTITVEPEQLAGDWFVVVHSIGPPL